MKAPPALLPLVLLAACGGGQPAAESSDTLPDLERAAIVRGMVRDPADTDISGLYARDTDRACVVPADYGYRVGIFVDYGDGITCSASGKASRAGDVVRMDLGQGGDCGFDVRFDGDRLRFPGNVPDGCASLCSGRASLAGLEVARLSESSAEAAAMRDARGRRLCVE